MVCYHSTFPLLSPFSIFCILLMTPYFPSPLSTSSSFSLILCLISLVLLFSIFLFSMTVSSIYLNIFHQLFFWSSFIALCSNSFSLSSISFCVFQPSFHYIILDISISTFRAHMVACILHAPHNPPILYLSQQITLF